MAVDNGGLWCIFSKNARKGVMMNLLKNVKKVDANIDFT